IITSQNREARWRGQQLRMGQLNVNRPGQVMDHLSSTGYESLVLLVDGDELRKNAQLLYGMDLLEQLQQSNVVNAGQPACHTLEKLIRQILDHSRIAPAGMANRRGREPFDQICVRPVLQPLLGVLPDRRQAAEPPNRHAS